MTRRKNRVATLPGFLFVVGLLLPETGRAQQRAESPTREPEDGEIIVRAERGDRTLIDRDTYVVRDTPLAQTRTAVDVIQNLPSVSIDATGQLRLLGNRNVKILIDGRDVPNANAILGSLQASQIARIEVMTNPSAQFSAYGSAGIINIILRRSFADGLGGAVLIGTGSSEPLNARLSPTWSDGTWSISASPALTLNESWNERRLERFGARPDESLNRIQDERGRGTSRSASATTQISFRPSSTARYDATGSIIRVNGESRRSTVVSSPLASFAPFIEASGGTSALESESLSVERTTNGSRPGEELKLSASWSHNTLSAQGAFAELTAVRPRSFQSATSTDQSNYGVKADYRVPVGERGTVSAGVEVQRENDRIMDVVSGDLLSGPVNRKDAFTGRWLDLSAYGTFQAEIGSFKLLPGLRVQSRRYEFDSVSGLAPVAERSFSPACTSNARLGM